MEVFGIADACISTRRGLSARPCQIRHLQEEVDLSTLYLIGDRNI